MSAVCPEFGTIRLSKYLENLFIGNPGMKISLFLRYISFSRSIRSMFLRNCRYRVSCNRLLFRR